MLTHTFLLSRIDIIFLERIACRTLQIGDRFIQLSARTKLVAPRIRQSGLAFENAVDV